MKKIFIILSILSFEFTFSQSNDEKAAREFIKLSLKDKTQHNVINKNNRLIKSETAVSIAESILFQIYGKEKILDEKPYKIFHIDNYWLIEGTLKKDYLGGVFQIIIDDRTGEIKRITHGK